MLTWTPPSLGARTHPGADRGCGVLVDSAHPWHSQVPGGNVATGDHWITARNGRFSTCAFTQVAIHRLLALPARTYQADDVGQLLGGVCDWTHGTGHETIRPFAEIECHLPTPDTLTSPRRRSLRWWTQTRHSSTERQPTRRAAHSLRHDSAPIDSALSGPHRTSQDSRRAP